MGRAENIVFASNLVLAGLAGGCATTVEVGQRGVASYATARQERPIRSPGRYLHWPWQRISIYDVTWQAQTEQIGVATADERRAILTVTVTFRPTPDRVDQLHADFGPGYYGKLVRPLLGSLVRSEIARHLHDDLFAEGWLIERALLAQLRRASTTDEVEIQTVSLGGVEFDGAAADLSNRHKAEEKEYEVLFALRDSEIARIRALGEADAIRIRSEAEAQALLLLSEVRARVRAGACNPLGDGIISRIASLASDDLIFSR